MTSLASVQHDPFASRIFERDVFALTCAQHGAALEEALPGVLAEYREKRPVLICAKVPTANVGTVACLEALGFGVVETNVTLKRQVQGAGSLRGACEVGFAVPEDEAGVRAVAGSAFRYSRFHVDPRMDNAMADRFKSEWAGNFFSGKRGDHMVVARMDGRVAGFLQLLQRDGVLVIDLVAVDASFRRRGVAADMMTYAQEHSEGIRSMQVGTQAANTVALRCYETAGFVAAGSSYALHYHNA